MWYRYKCIALNCENCRCSRKCFQDPLVDGSSVFSCHEQLQGNATHSSTLERHRGTSLQWFPSKLQQSLVRPCIHTLERCLPLFPCSIVPALMRMGLGLLCLLFSQLGSLWLDEKYMLSDEYMVSRACCRPEAEIEHNLKNESVWWERRNSLQRCHYRWSLHFMKSKYSMLKLATIEVF